MIVAAVYRLRAFWRQALDISRFGSLLALTMTTDALLAGLSVASGVLAARLLGPTGRGELAAIQTWPTLLASFAMLGIPAALAYYSAREPDNAGRRLTTAMLSTALACLPFVVAGYLILPRLLSAQSAAVVQAAREYLWLLPLYALVGMLHHPLRGRNDLGAWNLVRLMPTIMWILLLLTSAVVGFARPAPLARGYLIGLALLFFPMGYVVIRRLPGSFRPSTALVRPMLRYGLPSVLSVVPSTLNLRLDQMLMAGLLAPQVLGWYVVAVAWSGAVSPLLGPLSSTMLPRVAGAPIDSTVNRSAHQAQLLAQSARLGCLLASLMAAGIALIAPLAVPIIFGQAYFPAVPAAMILSVAAGILILKDVMAAGALSLGQPRFVLLAESVGLVVTVTLLWLLLRPFQLIGAALASAISYATVLGVLVQQLRRQTGLTASQLLVPTRADIVLVLSKFDALRTARGHKPAL